ncbi:nuclear pore complex protein Nup160 [Rhipicephalus sanguineus]|uniref:nuclear pore complex protein Nup160 n=1 Tax=Rhipicephalus sanguineus TaxID=34632 RepID=UPI0018945200|nr:nuclear pore complex protein Nup160 [Rhipicephalus sanguineus]
MLEGNKYVKFVEVPLRETSPPKWKELTINTGAAQSTLEDIKLTERAGGYAYQEDPASGIATRNRFIYWKTNHNVLELTEESLDVDLIGNRLRLRFQHTPLLEGVSVFETRSNLVVLAATIASVHRLSFPHPRLLNPNIGSASPYSMRSVFFDTSATLLRDYHVLNHAGLGTTLSHNSCSWLGANGEAIFVLGTNTSTLFVVSIDPQDAGGKVSTMEIRKSASVTRFLSGILPASMRGDEASLSLVCHQADDDIFIFALSRDLRIRQWSYRSQDLLSVCSVLDHWPASKSTSSGLGGRQSCMVKATDSSSSGVDVYLGVYACFPEGNQFFVFQPIQPQGGGYKLVLLASVRAPENDLVDFCLMGSTLWTLWVQENDEPLVCTVCIDALDSPSGKWAGVHLQPSVPPEKDYVPAPLDPREHYLEKIIGRSVYSFNTLWKVLGTYARRGEHSADHGGRSLKEEIMITIEAEIRAGIAELELGDQDYVSLASHHWGKFDYACTEYHAVGLKPLGLFVDPNTGMAALIRRDHVSLLRPCEWQESCMLSEVLPPWCSEVADEGVQILASCLKMIDSCLTQEVLAEFSQGLHFVEDIQGLIDRVVFHLLSPEYSIVVKKIIDTVHTNLPSLKNLIDSMNLSQVSPCTRLQGLHSNAWQSLFGSATGCSFIAGCLQQVMQFRFTFCRNLLVLQGLIVAAGQNRGALDRQLSLIGRKLIPETQRLVQAYYAALWVTESEGSPLSNPLEGGIKGMSISSGADGFGVISQNAEQCGLVWIFLRNGGGEAVRRQLCEKGPPEASQIWAPILPSFISTAAELIWPLSDNCVFLRSLLELSQHLQLQEYVRLLTDWCDNNRETRMYLLATSFLVCHEFHKACMLYQKLANEHVPTEPYIMQQIQRVGSSDPPSEQSLLPLYYRQVIKAFTDAPECVITLAEAALKCTPKDDSHVPGLWSLLFKHQLQLGHITEAYHAMIQNPLADDRNNCLQQLVIVLCERGQLSTLVNFPFKGVESDVIRILEARARATDVLERHYYDVLYCMHINAKKYRRAASAMYEHAFRLQQEAGTLEALKRQELCLLAAINCLLLVKPEDAWVAMPLPVGRAADRSPKRDSMGEEIPHAPTRKVEVIQVEDIRRKLSLVRAWLLLSSSSRDPITLPLSPDETVLLLVGSGHFNIAIHICKQFSMNLDPVFEGVVQQCIKSSPVQTMQSARAINPQWIIENPKAVLDIPGQAWLLLRHYLEQYEKEPGTTRYHRLVASKLLCNGFLLPPWLTESYKERDAPELLRLLMVYSRLEEATDISIEYVDAVLGKGKEYFGLTSALHASSPPVWLPHTTFDRLLVALKSSANTESQYQKLNQKLKDYFKTLERVSLAMRR